MKRNHYFKHVLITFFLTSVGYANAQNIAAKQSLPTYNEQIDGIQIKKEYTKEDIDSQQILVISSLINQRKFKEIFLLSKELILASEKLNYPDGVTQGYIDIANGLYHIGKFDESLRFLKRAEEQEKSKNNYYIQGLLYIEYGNNFETLGFSEKATQAYNKAIQYGLKIKEYKKRGVVLLYVYNHKATSKNIAKTPDSTLFYFKKSYQAYPEGNHGSIVLTNIGDWYTRNNKPDSAVYYFDKASKILQSKPHLLFNKACLEWGYGTHYFFQKQYKEAIIQYENAEKIFKKLNTPTDLVGLYKLMSMSYDSLGIPQKSQQYILKHTLIKDSLNNIKQPALDNFVVHFVEQQEKKDQATQHNLYYIIVGILLASMLITYFGYSYYQKNKTKSALLAKNKTVLVQKNQEVKELEQKVNESFEEIIQLAKENSPEFWGRFQEVYPEFSKKVLEINPHLKTSELTLCAYIYLGFNTKDIAEYTFKAVQTIKNNKYNLRKRLNVPTQEDIMIWIRTQTNL